MRACPGLVRRMRLAGDDELHRALRIGQDTSMPGCGHTRSKWVLLLSREAARKAQREDVGSKRWFAVSTSSDGAPAPAKSRDNPRARVLHKSLAGGAAAELPERASVNLRECPVPKFADPSSQRSCPQASCQRLSAAAESQVGAWTPLVTYPIRDSCLPASAETAAERGAG